MNKMAHLTFAKIEIRKMNQKWKIKMRNRNRKQKSKMKTQNGDQEQKWLTEKTDQRMIRNTNFQNILNNTMHACEYSVE